MQELVFTLLPNLPDSLEWVYGVLYIIFSLVFIFTLFSPLFIFGFRKRRKF